jgi:hypothetical protein
MIPFIPGGSTDFVSGGVVLIIFGALLAYFRNVPGKLYSLFERCCITRIDIQEEDESFQWMKLWLSKQLESSLSVSVFTRRPQAMSDDDPYERDPRELYKIDKDATDKRPRIIFTPAPGWYWFFYEGKLVTVSRHRTEPEGKGVETTMKPRESFTMRVFSRNLAISKRMIEEARDFALPKDGKVEIRTCSGHYWNLTGRIRPRSLDSVVLEGNIAENVLSDIRRFQKDADWYGRIGTPYRRGYLFYGPPGNGKSSFVLAIASELGMNVNVLNLSTPGMNDAKLVELLSNVDTNTLVLIEDIDCAFVKRKTGSDRKDKLDFGLTFSGVLNALDGILAQDGRIVFMTTNHPEKLDEALIRDGRADVKVYIGNATREQIYRLFLRFYPDVDPILAERYAGSVEDGQISMSKVQGHLMRYRWNPEEAVKNVSELLQVQKYEQSVA